MLLAFLVLLVAVFLGLLTSGFLANHTPLFRYMDQYHSGRGKIFMGGSPGTHEKDEWGYSLEQFVSLDLAGKNYVITGGNSGMAY